MRVVWKKKERKKETKLPAGEREDGSRWRKKDRHRMGHLARPWWDSIRRWLLLSSRIIAASPWLAVVTFCRRSAGMKRRREREREREKKRKIWNQDEYSNAYTRGFRPSEMKGCRTNRARRGGGRKLDWNMPGVAKGSKKKREKKRNCSLVDGT